MGVSRVHFEDDVSNKKEIQFGVVSSSWGLINVKRLQLKNVSNLSIYIINSHTKNKQLVAKLDKHFINLDLTVKESNNFPYCDLMLNNQVIYSRKYCFACILECKTNCFVHEKIEKI